MRPFTLIRIAVAGCIALTTIGQASACKCSSGFHGKNRWETAKQEETGSIVIFEGTPERFDLQWDFLNAKAGEWIPTENQAAKPDEWPRMRVTFRVQRLYKGEARPEIQIITGLGGGDCGAIFEPGLTYLVFASSSSTRDLWVSMCSPGGWVGNSSVDTELRYLRKERPIARDLEAVRPLTADEYTTQEGKRRRDFEEYQKRYAAVTGKICGTVAAKKAKDGNTGMVSFLSLAGYSPVAHPTASVNADGSFCSQPLGPGKYYLQFMRSSEEGLTSAVYYPGVSERNKAAVIEVNAGQPRSDVTFNVPVEKTYSVRGVISTNDKSGLNASSVYVVLVSLDGVPFPSAYSKPIDFEGSFPLPKVKYFEFENVLPGRYLAYVSLMGQGWYTKKEEVSVTTHMRFISLQLMHNR
jgi:hypothetical protein